MATMVVSCTRCRRQIRLPGSAQNERFGCGRCGEVQQIRPRMSLPVPGIIAMGGNKRALLVGVSYRGTPHELDGNGRCGEVQQIRPRMSLPVPGIISVGGNKRALLVGVSYRGTPHELDGSINDVSYMRDLLTTKFNFLDDFIITLTEDVRDSKRIPTKQNIVRALQWLVEGCSPGDSLVFHFSGHGLQEQDFRGEEMDGYNETLLPMDFQKAGVIVDNYLNELIIRPLTQGVRLHALVDACQSGTILDIPYVCCLNKHGKCMWEDHTPPNGAYKGTSGGEAFSLTGCTDEQTTIDSKVKSSGIMTSSFIEAIEEGEAATYGKLLRAMSKYIAEYGENSTLPGAAKAFQEPQLSSSYPFDIDDKPFYL